MAKDSFVFYRSFYEAINELPEKEQLEIYRNIASFALDFESEILTGISKAVFALIKPQLEANNKKYENGKKGGRPKNETVGFEEEKPNENQTKTKTKPNVNDNVNVNVNANENVNENELSSNELNKEKNIKKRNVFVPPSIQAIEAYIQERKNGLSAEHFYNYYQSNGWMVGKNKMKDWKATIRTWEHNNKSSPKAKGGLF